MMLQLRLVLGTFFAGAMSSISGNTAMVGDSSQTLTANFNNAGTAFNAQIDDGNFSKLTDNTDGTGTISKSDILLNDELYYRKKDLKVFPEDR